MVLPQVRALARSVLLAAVIIAVASSTGLGQGAGDLTSLNREAWQLYQADKSAEALSVAEQALKLAETQLGPDHLEVARAARLVGLTLAKLGRNAEAEKIFRRAVSISQQTLDQPSIETATVMSNLSRVLYDQSNFPESALYSEKVLAAHEAIFGPQDTRVADSLNALANVYSM